MKPGFLLLVFVSALRAADAACDPKDFAGNYGFLLTGSTSIGSETRPVAVVGRLIMDGSGKIEGISSAAFTGLVLGNPVTGTYEAKTDCTVTWRLQDDSGGWQNFAGTMSDRGGRATFHQTDQGGAGNGQLLRAPDTCTAASLQGRFNVTVSDSTVNVDTARTSGRVSFKGSLQADGAGNFSYADEPEAPPVKAGTYEFQDGCFVQFTMQLPESRQMQFRGMLVDGGKTVIGIQTDPGSIVSLRLLRP